MNLKDLLLPKFNGPMERIDVNVPHGTKDAIDKYAKKMALKDRSNVVKLALYKLLSK